MFIAIIIPEDRRESRGRMKTQQHKTQPLVSHLKVNGDIKLPSVVRY